VIIRISVMQVSALFSYPNVIRGCSSLNTIVIKYILSTWIMDFSNISKEFENCPIFLFSSSGYLSNINRD